MNNITVGKNVPNQMATANRDLDELKSLFSQGSTAINFFNMTSPVQGLDSKGVEQLGTQLSEADIANYNEISNTSNLQGKGGVKELPKAAGNYISGTSTPKVNEKKFTKTGGDDGLHYSSREDAEKFLKEKNGYTEAQAKIAVDNLIESGDLKIQPPLSETYKARQAELDAQHAGEQAYDKWYGENYDQYKRNEEKFYAEQNPEYDYQEMKRWQDPNYATEQIRKWDSNKNAVLSSYPNTSLDTSLEKHIDMIGAYEVGKQVAMNHYLNEPAAKTREALALFTQGAATTSVTPSTPSGSGITFSSRTRGNPIGNKIDLTN